jgi:hypothetical protein
MGQELLEAAAGAGDSHLWHVGSRLAHVIGASGICANEIGTVLSTTRGGSTRMKAMVALWHQGEGKGLVIETHDLRALVDEMKDNNKGVCGGRREAYRTGGLRSIKRSQGGRPLIPEPPPGAVIPWGRQGRLGLLK